MPCRRRLVDCSNGRASEQVDGVETLREFQQILQIRERARPAAPIEIGAVGRTCDRAEADRISTKHDMALGITCLKRDFAGNSL